MRLLFLVWKFLPAHVRWLFILLVHPRHLVGVMGVTFTDAGEVLLVRHSYRRRYPWGLPGGWLERVESPRAAIAREIAEETGFTIAVEDLLAAEKQDDVAALAIAFRCRLTGGTFRPSEEITEYRLVPPGGDFPPLRPFDRWLLDLALAPGAAQGRRAPAAASAETSSP